MKCCFRVVTPVFADGERCPMLVDAAGMPLFDPTVWSVARYRHRAAATMEQALRGASLLHVFCSLRGIDLAARIQTGSFFATEELDALADAASKLNLDLYAATTSAVADSHASNATTDVQTVARRARLLRRLPSAARMRAVSPQTARIKLHYLKEYLRWLAERQRGRLATDADDANAAARAHSYHVSMHGMIEQIEERTPGSRRRGRLSLTREQLDRLLAVTDPNSVENPWHAPFVRLRNWVIIKWLLGTGARRGELLALWVKDLNTRNGSFDIIRRHDSRRDPRRAQPNAKTLERSAPLGEELILLGERYLKARNQIEAARKHPFLFVSEDGRPLSVSALVDLFATLRQRRSDVGPVTAHILRHQWNENFSSYADSVGMSSEDENKERCLLMGWSPTSQMPGLYLKRRTKQKADEHSRKMQSEIAPKRPEVETRFDIAASVNATPAVRTLDNKASRDD